MSFPSETALVATPGWNGAQKSVSQDRISESLDFVQDLREDFEKRDATFKLIDAVVFLEQAVNIPENFKNSAIEVRSPFARHIANQITAALSINNPKVSFEPIRFGDPGENEAAHRSRFFEGSWLRQQREKKRRIFRLFMDAVVTKGEGVLKTMERKNRAWAKYTPYSRELLTELDKQVKEGYLDQDSRTRIWDAKTEEMKRRLPYPIETTEIPPETFYYQFGEDGFVRVAEINAVPYYETLLRNGAALNEQGKVVSFDDVAQLALPSTRWGECFEKTSPGRRTIEKVELWDHEKVQVILRGPGDIPSQGTKRAGGGRVVKEWYHGYGDPDLGVLRGPYFHASGILTSSREPHKARLSILYAYLHLFPLLNALLTMQSQAAYSFSYPAYRRTTPPTYNLPESPFGSAADEIVSAREKIVPGAIFPHDIAPMDQPHTSVDLDKAIQFVKSMIDLALPDTLQGAVTGEMAGYTLNQAAHLATLTWGPIVDNVQDCLSDRVGWESRLIDEHIGETVYVWGRDAQSRKSGTTQQSRAGWIGLGPKDIEGVHNYQVTLEPATINTDQLELRVLKEELDMRLIDPAEAVRKRGRNPVEVERAWLLYELKQDPEIRNNLKQRIFQELGTIEQQKMQALGPEGAPEAPVSGMPAGATPGVSEGLPATGFVLPQGSIPAAPPPPGPDNVQLPPGPAPGSPAGARPVPANHQGLPGGG
jgi:hypothetical protein